MALSSLDALIQAAQFIEQNGGENDAVSQQKKRTHRHKMRKPSTYRTTHNLLEKNRRAQLRDCLEVLRQHVPLPDKLTTLALLQSAKKYIENLQLKEKEENTARTSLRNEQSMLLSRLAELGAKSVLETTPTKASSPEVGVSSKEEDESMAIDVESEDETSSITSGSDGGCTSTSHRFVANAV